MSSENTMGSGTTERDYERAPEIAALNLEERPDGLGAAAMFAAAIGVFALGLLTILSEASASIHDWLEAWDFDQGVGPLAGKTTVAVIVWVASWIVLSLILRGKDVDLKKWIWASVVLGIIGVLGTFPPIFTAFAAE
ncbi:MAG TPA: hypothetical protein VFK59_05465 [Actinomycetota bacterium]|jgi:hypothetical protein|nr:hypothetical protein [Actinomycetota bacterium]